MEDNILPNLVTHYLCGIEATKLLQNKKCRTLIENNQNIFNLGVQGPDFLFYYAIWPWLPKGEAPNIGTEMHASKINLVFKGFIEYILKQNEYTKNKLVVYLLGFVCHNCLDSITHPYIFYRSGFETADNPNTKLYTCYHRRFETAIDVLMCKRILNKKVHEIDISDLIKVTEKDIDIISEMYKSVIKTVYNSNLLKERIVRSINDMAFIENLFKDPFGIKKKILATIDYIIHGMPLYSSMIFPLKISDKLDYLNLDKKEWLMPFDKNQKSTLSFLELYKEACERTYRYCEVLFSSIFNDNASIPYALKLLGNRSYTSGIDCNIPVKFRYHDIIFK